MGRVVHFEITADDPDRAAAFYRRAFGWEITGWGGGLFKYLLATTGPEDSPGINGAITDRQGQHQAVINSIGVESWESAAAAVTEAGGKVLMAKTPIPGIGYFAYCTDTEGNVFGIMQEDAAAKEMPVARGAGVVGR
jgi:uncharacterized protein